MRQILGYTGAVLALLFFVASSLFLYWMWHVREPTLVATKAAFTQAGMILKLADTTIERTQESLRHSLQNLHYIRASASADSKQVNFLERTLTRSLARKVSPDLAQAQNSLEKVTEASIVVHSILESLQGVEWERLDVDQVRQLQVQVNKVTIGSLELGDVLAQSPDIQSGMTPEEKSASLAHNLDQIIQEINHFRSQVQNLIFRLHRYQDKSEYWIEHIPVWASAALAWILMSQVVVFRCSWKWSRTQ